jgi:hypothetical protein
MIEKIYLVGSPVHTESVSRALRLIAKVNNYDIEVVESSEMPSDVFVNVFSLGLVIGDQLATQSYVGIGTSINISGVAYSIYDKIRG